MTAFELPPPIVDVEVMVPTLEVSVCSVVMHLSFHVTSGFSILRQASFRGWDNEARVS